MDLLRISAKNLGAFAIEDACPRCLWHKLRMQQKLPYQIFPGIFSTIDSFSKRITHLHFEATNELPPWLTKVGINGNPLPSMHYSRFQSITQEGVQLTGVPDEIIKLKDGTMAIIDNKTAKLTEGQDDLLPLYEAQLNGYAVIAQAIGLGKTSRLGLVYFEPQGISEELFHEQLRVNGFAMDFSATFVPVALDAKLIPRLLSRARRHFDLPEPPVAKDGCKDCRLVEQMIDLVGHAPIPS